MSFDDPRLDCERFPDIEFRLLDYPLDLPLQTFVIGGRVILARDLGKPSDPMKNWREAMEALYGASADVAKKVVEAVEHWHIEPPRHPVRDTGFKGRAARRREARGEDPYDDQSHYRNEYGQRSGSSGDTDRKTRSKRRKPKRRRR